MSVQFVGLNSGDKLVAGRVYRATFEKNLLGHLTLSAVMLSVYNTIGAQTMAFVVSEPPVAKDGSAVIDVKARTDAGGYYVSQLANALDGVSDYATLMKLESTGKQELGTATRGASREQARTTAAAQATEDNPFNKFVGALKTARTLVIVVVVGVAAVVGVKLARDYGVIKRGK